MIEENQVQKEARRLVRPSVLVRAVSYEFERRNGVVDNCCVQEHFKIGKWLGRSQTEFLAQLVHPFFGRHEPCSGFGRNHIATRNQQRDAGALGIQPVRHAAESVPPPFCLIPGLLSRHGRPVDESHTSGRFVVIRLESQLVFE